MAGLTLWPILEGHDKGIENSVWVITTAASTLIMMPTTIEARVIVLKNESGNSQWHNILLFGLI
jgi:hypothetical protein